MSKRYAFIGAGNMAGAIVRSFISQGVISPEDIIIYDVNKEIYKLYSSTGVKTANDANEAVAFGDYIVLAVKPQFMLSALDSIKAALGFKEKVYISIAAGISIDFICDTLGEKVAVIRTMPNTPFLVSMGAIAISKNEMVSDIDFNIVINDFNKVAITSILTEEMMNSVVSVVGSSPAYVFKFINAMLEGAITQGFNQEQVKDLILRTIEGSVEMVRSSGKPIKELIDNVTSKKGTTEKAIQTLDSCGFEEAIIKAMDACTIRAIELSKQ